MDKLRHRGRHERGSTPVTPIALDDAQSNDLGIGVLDSMGDQTNQTPAREHPKTRAGEDIDHFLATNLMPATQHCLHDAVGVASVRLRQPPDHTPAYAAPTFSRSRAGNGCARGGTMAP
ncbi:MAG: hypothetical protein K0Q93_2673 [Nocardioidaceae bacterium]|nr:hypothetical protein [Nocardioidaceae bacterium]